MNIQHIIGYILVLGAPTVLCAVTWVFPVKDNQEGKQLLRGVSSVVLVASYIGVGVYLLSI